MSPEDLAALSRVFDKIKKIKEGESMELNDDEFEAWLMALSIPVRAAE